MSRLLLIPTEIESRELLDRCRGISVPGHAEHPVFSGWRIEHCGLGVVAAAARSAALIESIRPSRIVLAGIAGALDETLAIGTAYEFRRVWVDGLGAGSADRGFESNYLSIGEMGWAQWPGDEMTPRVGDVIALDMPPPDDGRKAFDELAGLGLLTVCAASGDRRQSERRRHDYPEAAAEDMEGFGVAMSCVLAGIPLRIIRGISNVAGNRNASQWKIGDALTAVAERLGTLLAEDRGGTTGLDTPNKKGTE